MNERNILRFKDPAAWWGANWRESLPSGNGKTGAAVAGGAGEDALLLTRGDLWWQGSGNVLPDVADKIKDVKKFLDSGRLRDAEQVLPAVLKAKGYRAQAAVPLPVCYFKISMPLSGTAREYSRSLDMESGEIEVAYRDGATKFRRAAFVSRPDDAVYLDITKSGPGGINAAFSLSAPGREAALTPDGAYSKTPEDVKVKSEAFFIYFSARSDTGEEFGAVAYIKPVGGSCEAKADYIRVKDASRVTVFIKPFVSNSAEAEWKKLKGVLSGVKPPYEKLLKAHAAEHARLFNSAELNFDDGEERGVFIEDLIERAFREGVSRALIQKLWSFGRYLTVSATAEDGKATGSYGLWCGEYKAAGGEPRYDGALQVMYRHAFAGGLFDAPRAVFNTLAPYTDDFKKNAARLYGARGIMVPTVTAQGGGLPGSLEPKVLHTTCNAGLIAQMYYDYYLYTGDMKFLKNEALPFMKETALFYEEFFKVGANGRYCAVPSYSPDNTPGNFTAGTAEIVRNATVDFAVAKYVLLGVIAASEETGSNKADIAKWKDMLTRIPDYSVGADGALSEYCDSDFADNHTAATCAHLFPAYPGAEFTDGDGGLSQAALIAARKRAASSSGNATAAAWARLSATLFSLGDADGGLELLNRIASACLMRNLVTARNDWRGMGMGRCDAWAPYDISGNLGVTGAVQEMLVRSRANYISVLPALPELFFMGEAKGLLTRAGAEITLEWNLKKGYANIALKGRRRNMLDLRLPKGTRRYKGPLSEKYDPETRLVRNLELPQGKTLNFEIKF